MENSPNTISLNSNSEETSNAVPISLETDSAPISLDPATLGSRSFKADYGMSGGKSDKNAKDEIRKGIEAGMEDDIRTRAASSLNEKLSKEKQAKVIEEISKKKGPLTPEDMLFINGTKPVNLYNRNSVFEYSFANAAVKELEDFAQRVGEDNIWSAGKTDPVIQNDIDAMKHWGSTNMAKYQYIMTKLQNNANRIHNQSWPAYLWDTAKQFSMIYSEVMERNVIPDSGIFEGLDLGSNLTKQRDRLWDLDWNKFTKVVDDIEDRFKDNPLLLQSFFSSMSSMSGSDKALKSLNTIGLAAALPGTASRFIKIGSNVYDKTAAYSSMRKAIWDLNKASMDPSVSKARVLEGVGDLEGAALEKVGEQIKRQGFEANPTREGLNALDRNVEEQIRFLQNDQSLSENLKRAIIDQYKSFQAKVNLSLGSAIRPFRIPFENLTPEQINLIKQQTFDRYPGLSNSIIHMSDPILEPLSNTYYVKGWVGKGAGEFFQSFEEAANYAKFHGLKVSLSDLQLSNLEAQIARVKEEIKIGIDMDADVNALNRYYSLENQLKDLENLKKEFSQKGGYKIGQEGLGHYIEVDKFINEEDKLLRKFIIDADRKYSNTPKSWVDRFPYFSVSKVRTAEDTMSFEHRQNRKATLYPQSVLMGLAHQEGKYISDVFRGIERFDPETGLKNMFGTKHIPIVSRLWKRKEGIELREVLNHNKNMQDPSTGLPGYYFKDYDELNKHFLTVYEHSPSPAQTQAYFAVKRWGDFDHILREITLYRNQARLGVENHKIILKDLPDNILNKSPEFKGVSRNSYPGGKGNILIVHPDGHTSIEAIDRFKGKKEGKELAANISEGKGKLIELYKSEDKPFNGFVNKGDKYVDYVYSPHIETSPLNWDQLPYRGGGHFEYNYELAIKQPIISTEKVGGVLTHNYGGDRTVHFVTNNVIGKDFINKLNAVKNLIRDGDDKSAKTLFLRSGLPYEWKEFRAKFNPYKDENGIVQPAKFNTDTDFFVVPKNRKIIDLQDNGLEKFYNDKAGEFVDRTRKGMFRNFQVEFTGARDAEEMYAVKNTGTVANPVYALDPAEKLDALRTNDRAIGSIARSFLLDDYKAYAVKSWLAEAVKHDLLKADDSKVFSSPYWFFKNANENIFRDGVTPDVRQKFLSNKIKIEQLIGQPSDIQSKLQGISQSLSDSIYRKTGHDFLLPQHLLAKTRDPFAFIRSITFNAYLGLFSPVQLFVQMSTFANMFAIAPRYTTVGTGGALLHGYAAINRHPEILNKLDELASSLKMPGLPSWKPGEWKEANEVLSKTGFMNVAGEFGPLDSLNQAKIIGGPGQHFLSWGQAPFKAGERSVRAGAWYTAFKEFRESNPTGKLTRADEIKILDRADFLYGNMSSASNSLVHTGFMSIPAQFFAYTLRQSEIFFSKRLGNSLGETPWERAAARARLLAVNATLFGVPTAFGLSGLPVTDYLRRSLMDTGFLSNKPYSLATVDKPDATSLDWVEHLAMEGLPATMLNLATGHNYNVGPRYGLQGLTSLTDIVKGDLNIFGATGSLATDFAYNTAGVRRWLGSIIKGTYDYPLTIHDLLDAIKTIKSASDAQRLYMALNTGKWIDKHNNIIGDVSPANALFMSLTGLSPQEQLDRRNVGLNLEDQQDVQKQQSEYFKDNMRRWHLSLLKDDVTNADVFMKKAISHLAVSGMREDQIGRALAAFEKEYDLNAVNKIYFERYFKHIPAEPYFKTFGKGSSEQRIDNFRDTFKDMSNRLQKGL